MLPRAVRLLVGVAVVAGAAVLIGGAVAVAGDPLERPDIVALLAAGMLLAELFPLQIPGREEETSFSTAFTLALLVTHGPAVTVLVATAALVAADLVRRRELVKVAYNAGQYALSWGAAGLVFVALTGAADPPPPEPPLGDLAALVPAALAYVAVNGCLGALAAALIAGGPLWPQLRHSYGFALVTTAVLLTLAPIVVIVAAHELWLLPLLGPLLAAIEIGGHQSVLNDARARVDPLTGAITRGELERSLAGRLGEPASGPPAVVVLDVVGFADVNDALGHGAGDTVLRTVAERLARTVGRRGRIARIGGDAFALVCDADKA